MKRGNVPQNIMQILILVSLIIPCLSYAQQPALTASFGDGEIKNSGCIKCHGVKSLVSERDYIDPIKLQHTTHSRFGCTTCHDGVSKDHPNGKPVANTTNCADCHDDLVIEYSKSGHAAKATCVECHNPHQVSNLTEVSGDDLNKQCSKCHSLKKMTVSHSKWLPQTDIHLSTVACVTCHSGAENFITTFYISRKQTDREKLKPASYEELHTISGDDDLKKLIDVNRDNYISLNELSTFNHSKVYKDFCIKSMLTPIKATHSFKTYESRWDCTFCHASDHQTMQVSYVAFPNKDGTFNQVAVEKGAVLNSLFAIPDFYLMGSTRNASLNKIGLVIIAGGLIMPVGHGFLRFLSRKNRNKGERS